MQAHEAARRAADVAAMALALEERGQWGRAATEYGRAAELAAFGRDPSLAEDLRRRSTTCRRAADALHAA